MSVLIILVGLPASGKSTYIETYNKAIVVSPDEIRFQIFKTEFNQDVEEMVSFAARTMAKMLLLQDKEVIIDATNISLFRRKTWIDLGKECGAEVSALYMNVPYEECLARNEARERQVPIEVMERMRDDFVPPTTDEGFDQVISLPNFTCSSIKPMIR